MCLDVMVGLEDHMEEVVVVDVLDPTFVYTFICVEIKTNTERVAPRVFQKVQTTVVREDHFFYSYRGGGVIEGCHQDRFFFNLQFFTFCLTYNRPSGS